MDSVPEAVAATLDSSDPRSPARLSRSALGLQDVTASSIANMAPAFSVFFGLSAMVAEGGLPLALTLVIGAVAIALLCSTLSQFSRSIPSTGSFVTFIGKAFGPVVAIMTVVVITVGYMISIAGVMAISGDFIRSILDQYLHINPPWQLVTGVLVAVVVAMVLTGVKVSTRAALVMVVFEVLYLVVASIFILIHTSGSISLKPLDPSGYTNGVHGFGIAFALAVFIYLGWENSASMAEETTDPRRNVPKALFAGLGIIVAIYILASYAIITGFHNNATAITESGVPLIDAAKNASGFLEPVGDIAGISSVIAVLIAAANSQSRLMFNGAREGLIPIRPLGKVSKEHKAPWVALLAYIAGCVALVVIFAWGEEPGEFLAKAGTLGTIPVIFVYVLAHAALPIYWRRYHPDTFRPIVHLGIPVLGIAALGYPLWLLIEPGQAAPFNQYPWICLGLVVVSLVYGFFVSARTPGLGERIGSLVADE